MLLPRECRRHRWGSSPEEWRAQHARLAPRVTVSRDQRQLHQTVLPVPRAGTCKANRRVLPAAPQLVPRRRAQLVPRRHGHAAVGGSCEAGDGHAPAAVAGELRAGPAVGGHGSFDDNPVRIDCNQRTLQLY